ncbi:MAG: tyrosine-type recombinase/integrase [Candidatus Cryptobacteroides sp.]
MKDQPAKSGAVTLARLFSEFLAVNEGKRSACTTTGYRTAMKSFARFAEMRLGAGMGNFDITFFTESNVSRYMEWLQDKQGSSAQTCNMRLCQLRAFLKYASKDPSVMPYYLEVKRVVRYISENRGNVVEPLSKEVIEAIMKTPGTDTELGLRYTAFLSMMYTMALRVDELLSLKIRDIVMDAPKPYATVVGKGRKARTAYIMNATMKILKKYISIMHGKCPSPEAYVFYSKSKGQFNKATTRGVNKQLDKYAKEARKKCPTVPEHIHSHQFRHSMATHLLEDNVNVFSISKMLGHKSVETTMVYLGVTVSMTDAAIKKIESTAAQSVKPVWKKNITKLQDLF